MREALAAARASAWQGPLINGGNCLGIRSLPGRYDTMFIPEYKLPVPTGAVAPLAFVSQSGAFAVARMSKLGRLNPKYAITLGNQMDLTVGDYLAYLRTTRPSRSSPSTSRGSRRSTALSVPPGGPRHHRQRPHRDPLPRRPDGRGREGVGQPHGIDRRRLRGHARAGAGRGRRRGRIAGATSRTWSGCSPGCATSARTARGLAPSRTPGSSASPSPTTSAASICPPSTRPPPRGSTPIYREARIDSVVDVHNPIDLTPMTGDAAYEAGRAGRDGRTERRRRDRGLRAADGGAQHAAGRATVTART